MRVWKKIPNCWRCDFFNSAQSRVLSRENAHLYDGSASGELYLDTPRQITDAAGNIVWQWDNFDPFGNNVPNENPSGLGTFEFDMRFPGQVADKETGLFYNFFRDYDPATGRYVQSDPIGLGGGINTYTYALNNPLRYTDPTGQFAFVIPAIPAIADGLITLGGYLAGGTAVAAILSTSGDSSQAQSQARQADYEYAKNFCDNGPPSGENECSSLSKAIDHAEQCVQLYEQLDAKWMPGRHTEKIQTWRNRIQNLKDTHKQKCTNKCP